MGRYGMPPVSGTDESAEEDDDGDGDAIWGIFSGILGSLDDFLPSNTKCRVI